MDGFVLYTTDAVAQAVTQISNTFKAKKRAGRHESKQQETIQELEKRWPPLLHATPANKKTHSTREATIPP